jgi:hypothetical protein
MNLRTQGTLGVLLLISCVSAAGAANLSVVPKVGTLGVGLDLSAGWSEEWSTRLTINGLSVSEEVKETDVTYDADVDLRTVGLLADWHPFSGVFRLSAGAFYNGNEGSLNGKPTGGTFVINGVTYTAADIGSLTGSATFDRFAPYVGLGFSNAGKKGLKFAIDLGALYQNSPKVGLQAQCGPALPAPQCTTLQSDVQAEAARLEQEASDFKWYPVFSFGIGYSF